MCWVSAHRPLPPCDNRQDNRLSQECVDLFQQVV